MSLTIYLYFNGNCREVFEHYRSIFGGEFEMLSTFREGPEDMPLPEDVLDQVNARGVSDRVIRADG